MRFHEFETKAANLNDASRFEYFRKSALHILFTACRLQIVETGDQYSHTTDVLICKCVENPIKLFILIICPQFVQFFNDIMAYCIKYACHCDLFNQKRPGNFLTEYILIISFQILLKKFNKLKIEIMNSLKPFNPGVYRTLPVDFFDHFLCNSLNETNSSFPLINILEDDDHLRIELALPGYSKRTNQYELSEKCIDH